MRAIVTFLAVIAALVWSVVVWGSYLVVVLTTDFLAGPNGGLYLPSDIGQVAAWVGSLLDSYGSGTALVVWLLGLGLILLLRKLLHGLFRADSSKANERFVPIDGQPTTGIDGLPAEHPANSNPKFGR